MQSPRDVVIGKFCSTLLVNSRGRSSLHVVFSQTRNFTVIAFIDANIYSNSMAQRKSWKLQFRIEVSDSLHLPALSLLCAWARHLKTRPPHSKGPSNLHAREARFYRRLHLGRWNTPPIFLLEDDRLTRTTSPGTSLAPKRTSTLGSLNEATMSTCLHTAPQV